MRLMIPAFAAVVLFAVTITMLWSHLSSTERAVESAYSSGVGRLVELQVSGEDLALRLALRSVDAGRGSGRG